MSLDDFRGAAWSLRELMRKAQADIDAGKQKGAVRKWKTANPRIVVIGWMKRRLILGEYRKRA